MTMTPSIESVSRVEASRPAETAGLPQEPAGTRTADTGRSLGTDEGPASGLAALLDENSALADALRSLPDALDVSKAKAKLVDMETSDAVLQAAPVVQTAVDGPSMSGAAQAVSGVAPVSAIDASDMFLSAAEAVAAAVTVSPALMRGEAGEIRVQLQPDVLEGSEVVVAVDGRKMDVTFVPTVTHVADAILANQAVLQSQLVERISGFEISVGMIQAVATSVGSVSSVRTALNNMRRSNGRS